MFSIIKTLFGFDKGGRVTPSYISPAPPRKPELPKELSCIAKEVIKSIEENKWRLKEGGNYKYIYTCDGPYNIKVVNFGKSYFGGIHESSPLEVYILSNTVNNKFAYHEANVIANLLNREVERRFRITEQAELRKLFPTCFADKS